jgi:hypothetical protein
MEGRERREGGVNERELASICVCERETWSPRVISTRRSRSVPSVFCVLRRHHLLKYLIHRLQYNYTCIIRVISIRRVRSVPSVFGAKKKLREDASNVNQASIRALIEKKGWASPVRGPARRRRRLARAT